MSTLSKLTAYILKKMLLVAHVVVCRRTAFVIVMKSSDVEKISRFVRTTPMDVDEMGKVIKKLKELYRQNDQQLKNIKGEKKL